MTNFYKGKAWIRKRDNILRRDKYECRNCKRYGTTKTANTVHHIYFYEDYKELKLCSWNLISLCKECHGLMHDRTNDIPTSIGKHWQDKRIKEFTQAQRK